MLTLAALLSIVTIAASQSAEEFVSQPIPEYAEKLTGQELVDYVNGHQSFFKAEYSSEAEEYLQTRLMDLKFLKKPKDAYILPEEDLDNNAELPESFDAREHWPNCPSISYIRDQSSCGSCWAVSSAEVMSDRACIESDGRVKSHLSDSDIMTCCTDCGEDDGSYGGCKGGYLHKAFRYVMHNGVCTGGRYLEKNVCKPYPFYPCGRHKNQTYYGPCPLMGWNTPKCRKTCHITYSKHYNNDKIHVTSYYFLPNNETAIMREIMTNGPVTAGFIVYSDFSSYKGGVYVHTAGYQRGGHGVKIIGWGKLNGTPYWQAANSWNTDWGEDGYFKILRGQNHCGIEEEVVAGKLKV